MSSSPDRSTPEPDLKHAVALVTKMMAIPGPSGREAKILAFITQELRKAGVPGSAIRTDRVHQRSPYGGEVGNLIVRLPASKGIRAPRRLLVAHVDTVPICEGCRPVRRKGWVRSTDRTRGLGADNRSGAAAVLTAALTVFGKKLPHPPLTLFFPVQEEVGLVGARHVSLSDLGHPKLGFNFDGGSASKLTIGATGAYRLEIRIRGRASHAGVAPKDGISAITIAGLAIARLRRGGWLGEIRKRSHRGTSNIGSIHAGAATNVVPDEALLRAEVRSHEPGFRKAILDAFCHEFQHAASAVRNRAGDQGAVRVEHHLDYEAFKLTRREPCVAEAAATVRALGAEPVFSVATGGLDANWLSQRGVPTVTFGAGQHNAHTVNEMLNLDEFTSACRIALRLATAQVHS